MNSALYSKINEYYRSGLWDITRVKVMVKIGKLTREEYKEITSEEYNGD